MSYNHDRPVNISEDILRSFLNSFDSMTTDDDTLLPVGAIAGIAVGAVAAITIILVVTLYCCVRIRPL